MRSLIPQWPLTQCRSRARAFSLVEIVLALGLISFVLIATFGLMAAGLSASRDSEKKLAAANFCASVISSWRINPTLPPTPLPSLPALKQTGAGPGDPPVISSSLFLDAHMQVTAGPAEAHYRLHYEIQPRKPGSLEPANIYLKMTWPPQAKLKNQVAVYQLVTAVSLTQ